MQCHSGDVTAGCGDTSGSSAPQVPPGIAREAKLPRAMLCGPHCYLPPLHAGCVGSSPSALAVCKERGICTCSTGEESLSLVLAKTGGCETQGCREPRSDAGTPTARGEMGAAELWWP